TLRCKTLVVYYDQDSAATPGVPKTSSMGPTGTQQIRRMEAKGGVIVTQNDQVASGDNGDFDMPSNIVTLTGSVVVTQGQNVIKGGKLTVDLTTGVSHVSGGADRVQSLIIPSNGPKPETKPETKPGDAKTGDAKTGPAAAPAATGSVPKQRPQHPSGLY